jgi:hypothetical protein
LGFTKIRFAGIARSGIHPRSIGEERMATLVFAPPVAALGLGIVGLIILIIIIVIVVRLIL